MIEILGEVALRGNPPIPKFSGHDAFGYLPEAVEIDFSAGRIFPVENYVEVQAWFEKHRWKDKSGSDRGGTLYPPMTEVWVLDPITKQPCHAIPQSKRPAQLYRVPASHQMILKHPPGNREMERLGTIGFLMHLIGYLYDCRQQFHDWWLDTSVPMGTSSLHPSKSVADDFVERAYDTIRTWESRLQVLMTNILYMHCRAASHECKCSPRPDC